MTPVASAQIDFEAMDEVAKTFGAKGKLDAEVVKLGGKVVDQKEGLHLYQVGIDLSNSKVADADLPRLRDLLKVVSCPVSLDLSGTKISDAGLAHLQSFPHLYELALRDIPLTEAALARLHQALPGTRVCLKPLTLAYFPKGAIDPKSPLGDFLSDWYSEDLFAMKEPSLLSLAQKDSKVETYRFLVEPSFRGPTAVRIVLSGNPAVLEAVPLSRAAYFGGLPQGRKTVTLTPAESTELRRLIVDAKFWSLPTDFASHGGFADGASYIIEGVQGGKYHVVHHTDSHTKLDDQKRRFMAVCDAMLRLSGL